MTERKGLHDPEFERDSCGFGLIANLDDLPSHWVVATAISALTRLTHRGAVAADGLTGDGCGLLIKFPTSFLREVGGECGFELSERFAAGTVFLPRDEGPADVARKRIEEAVVKTGLIVAGWRVVPIDDSVCGELALKTLPRIEQLFVNAPVGMPRGRFNRYLFVARRRAENALNGETYIASLSSATISYKGMVMPGMLADFYPDLKDPRLESSVCVFHQRFSTNTLPEWRLAQPFRFLAHNGEINTIQGNRNWAVARAKNFRSDKLDNIEEITPLVSLTGSDSSSLDNMLEVMRAGGMDVLQAMRLLMPPAWQTVDDIDPDVRAFYEFYDCQMEPWDGPAGIVLTDGRYAVCSLDRNGLRPARYVITNDRHITIASEVGVYDYEESDVVEKGRLGPGEMLAVDLINGEVLSTADIHDKLKTRAPYKKWLKEGVRYLDSALIDTHTAAEPFDEDTLARYQKMFNMSREELNDVVAVLAKAGLEAVGSMGDDTPMAVLSSKIRAPFDYFRQQFAQVTNPPIDSLRERIVMSLQTNIGREKNLFDIGPEHAEHVIMNSPVLSQPKLRQLLGPDMFKEQHAFIDLNVDRSTSLPDALDAICAEAEQAVRDGKFIIMLSDRYIDAAKLPVHALLATGAVHHHLVQLGLRCAANIIVETGVARDPHHFACLIGYGATAVYPYLVYQSLHDIARRGGAKDQPQLGRIFRRGIRKGLFKIMSKMGISSIASYRGAQLFEIVGLADEVVDRCFEGTTSRIGGSNFEDLWQDQRALAQHAWEPREPVDQGGLLKFVHGGEFHCYNPDVVTSLQTAVKTGEYEKYREYASLVNDRPIATLRDLLDMKPAGPAIPLDEVEPVESILPRFDSAGMSLGALSPEAHEALAIAMNRIGARSNSGEGGEDPSRYGNERRSKIKQVASGRFGVTAEYLVNAEVIQIKIAQGAKPGEGGQLPGHKVNELIARLRYAKPGVGLISPPPHHDIYSIEDLAQLIHDLKNSNPAARVSVKLVSEVGVGTIAAGVSKAHADHILISGDSGGTGASPLTSIKHAGLPWELGIAETHQTLVMNDLRSRVVLQTDGGLKTGRDVVIAALLGAEEMGFSTAPLIALGCIMMRKCHLNTCPVGIATQDPVLRKKFSGKPEHVVNYLFMVAEEAREIMAELGFRRIADMIGRTDVLETSAAIDHWKADGLDLSPIMAPAEKPHSHVEVRCTMEQDHGLELALDNRLIEMARPAIEHGKNVRIDLEIVNTNRTVGTMLSNRVVNAWGERGLEPDTIHVRLEGSAGQSFGAFMCRGITLEIEGDCNDYVGKGLSGGRIIVYPPKRSPFVAEENVIIGNVALYGATGGRAFFRGKAAERFCVRNSGAKAVVEGVGDHGCEYMTGGRAVILGPTGINFAAGMSGGIAYVWDVDGEFESRCNPGMVDLDPVEEDDDIVELRELIEQHLQFTGSAVASRVLDQWPDVLGQFVKVMPTDYKRVLAERRQHDEEMEATIHEHQTGSFVAAGKS
ncbi:MAG: glutamate synthase large subunit [Gammaproteobacteria bacterium]|nr:glutamate synthase large subunit [Gammaproteobacteria bacterium]